MFTANRVFAGRLCEMEPNRQPESPIVIGGTKPTVLRGCGRRAVLPLQANFAVSQS